MPCKVGPDLDFLAAAHPTAPCRVSVLLGGSNIRLKFPRLCNAEVMELIISGRLWQSAQGVSCGYRVEVVQKFRVGEVLKSGGVISHDIFHPVDERDLGAVMMVALVEAGDLAEVGSWSTGSSAAFEVTT